MKSIFRRVITLVASFAILCIGGLASLTAGAITFRIDQVIIDQPEVNREIEVPIYVDENSVGFTDINIKLQYDCGLTLKSIRSSYNSSNAFTINTSNDADHCEITFNGSGTPTNKINGQLFVLVFELLNDGDVGKYEISWAQDDDFKLLNMNLSGNNRDLRGSLVADDGFIEVLSIPVTTTTTTTPTTTTTTTTHNYYAYYYDNRYHHHD